MGARAGSWRPKPIVQVAPDAFLFINGDISVVSCSSCNARRDIRHDITEIQINKSIVGTPGTATITIAAPIHGSINEYYFRDGKPVFPVMGEIEIYMKGRFLGADDLPRYYPVFWGIIQRVSDVYSNQTHIITLQCADMLRWLQILTTNTRVSAIDALAIGSTGQNSATNPTIYANRFGQSGSNIFTMIRDLFKISDADRMGPGLNLNSFSNLTTYNLEGKPVNFTGNPEQEMMKYWNIKLSRLQRALRIIGAGNTFLFSNLKRYDLKNISHVPYSSEGDMSGYFSGRENYGQDDILTVNFTEISHFRPFDYLVEMIPVEYSERKSRLDIINDVKDMIGWEFFQDMNGDILFKPPCWNIDVRPYDPVAWIRDTDIISWDFSEDETKIEATRVDVVGAWHNMTMGLPPGPDAPRGSYTDYGLAGQFGIRFVAKEAFWNRQAEGCFRWAVTDLDMKNVDRLSGSVTIVGRPELKLGLPIWIESKNMFYYVSSISHSFSFSGQSFTTTLGLVAGRYLVQKNPPQFAGGVAALPESYVDYVGVPINDKVLVDAALIYTASSSGLAHAKPIEIPNQHEIDQFEHQRKHNYTGTYLGDWVVKENAGVVSTTEKAMPYTDGSGFRLYGGFPWGRGLKVNAKGEIVNNLGGIIAGLGGSFGIASLAAAMATSSQPANIDRLQPDDKLLKFEDEITGVSQATSTTGAFSGVTPITALGQAISAQAMGIPLETSRCTCDVVPQGKVINSGVISDTGL